MVRRFSNSGRQFTLRSLILIILAAAVVFTCVRQYDQWRKLPRVLAVHVTANRTAVVAGREVPLENETAALRQAIESAKTRTRRPAVIVTVDPNALHADVEVVTEAIRRAGLQELTTFAAELAAAPP